MGLHGRVQQALPAARVRKPDIPELAPDELFVWGVAVRCARGVRAYLRMPAVRAIDNTPMAGSRAIAVRMRWPSTFPVSTPDRITFVAVSMQLLVAFLDVCSDRPLAFSL